MQRDLDELTYSGAAINELEVQLTKMKHLYQQVLVEGKTRVDMLRKKLHSHIVKSEPFVEIWRRARQVCVCVCCGITSRMCRLFYCGGKELFHAITCIALDSSVA